MIARLLEKSLKTDLVAGKVWMLFGARRVGKTSLIREFLRKKETTERWFSGQGEDAAISQLLSSCSAERLRLAFAAFDGVFIDEAQSVPNAGVALKLLVDTLPHLKVIVTGSSAFHLGQSLGQPLTGRRRVRHLHPISCHEIRGWKGPLAPQGLLEDLLVYGAYPEVLGIGEPAARREYLRQIVEDYLFQDILMFERLRDARKLRELVTLIAWQVGAEVSLSELGTQLQLNKATVERYLDLLEKNFILYRIGGYARNLRKEVTKSARWYFEDIGIRNAVIDQFQPLQLRPDKGALWENFVINERRKRIDYENLERTGYFWRTYDQQEIDRIEVTSGGGPEKVEGFECKWLPQSYKVPSAWEKSYPDAPVHLVHSQNFDAYF
ncbi:ATP-binding protein [Opitutaceae bacterium TAV4]|nr:ATP-binding protein [Opitutaceae bacterium TAV4]RRJ98392.1 ATP-binding protein [Opitutaceae bacterium TAV3]